MGHHIVKYNTIASDAKGPPARKSDSLNVVPLVAGAEKPAAFCPDWLPMLLATTVGRKSSDEGLRSSNVLPQAESVSRAVKSNTLIVNIVDPQGQ